MKILQNIFYISIFFLSFGINVISANIIPECDFINVLNNHGGIEQIDLANWLCLANYTSGLNTSLIKESSTNPSSISYGIFGVTNTYWCKDEHTNGRGGCDMECIDLTNEDLMDDIDCALKILSGSKFTGWEGWSVNCQYYDLKETREKIRECNKEIEDRVDECQIADSLFENGANPEELVDWLCLSSYSSGFRTSLNKTEDGINYYGIFSINNSYCFEEHVPSENYCNLDCKDLMDDNIIDDIKCALQIKDTYNFEYWEEWVKNCALRDLWNYHLITDYCDQEIEYVRPCFLANFINSKRGEESSSLSVLPDWLCIANYSSFNPFYKKQNQHNIESTLYGIFGIDNVEWCEDSQQSDQNKCEINCNNFLKRDLTEDHNCISKIYDEGGFEEWPEWKENCQDTSSFKKTIRECPFSQTIDECDFVETLYKNEGNWSQIPQWLCLAKSISQLNTNVYQEYANGAASYGIFFISNQYFCYDEKFPNGSNVCQMDCSELRDYTVKNDFECAKIIYEKEGGFAPWGNNNCEGKDLSEEKNIIKNCEFNFKTWEPIISTNPDHNRNINIERGRKLELNIYYDSVPPPDLIEWKFDLEDGEFKIEYFENRTVLIIESVGSNGKNSHLFNCTIENIVNKKEIIFAINITDPDEGLSTAVIIGISLGAFAVLVLIIGFAFYRRYLNKKEQEIFTLKEIQEFKNGNPELIKDESTPIHEKVDFIPYDSNYEIHKNHIHLDDEIVGSGQFGIVYRGNVKKEPVAVKTLKPLSDKAYIKALLSELKIMIFIGNHKNIVKLVGANTSDLKSGFVYLFLEFCELGSLEKYLRKNEQSFINEFENQNNPSHEPNDKFRKSNLYSWAEQITNGLMYLSNKKVVHADLACRNILLLDEYSIKITDFGLARQMYKYNHYVKTNSEPLPFRNMAIESLKRMEFSEKSDVWSFGITIWEILSFGKVPYANVNWSASFIRDLENGSRLERPQYCNEDVYNILLKCWESSPEKRPNFETLKNFFDNKK